MTPMTFAQKALAQAAGLSRVAIGEIVDARPDVALSHDNSAAIMGLWSRFGRKRVTAPERLAITLDHAVPAPTPRHAENHAQIRRFVAQQGIEHFFEAGRGICHQVLSEEALVLPGQLVLGADSHTPHFGWMGAFGAGIGRSEMAVLWATGELWLRVPESIRIVVGGQLETGVTAKDLALHLIGQLGADRGLYRCVELVGEGVDALTLSGRATLANMMAEMGVKASYLAPTAEVFEILAARRSARGQPTAADALRSAALFPDAGAEYAEEHVFDAAAIEPQVACPHTVDRVQPISQLGHVHIDQAFIGTCTNGRLEDLEEARQVLRRKYVARGTRLLVVPASSQVLESAIERGIVSDLLTAGAMLGTPGCGPCMGNHLGVLAPGEVCISSANRNFRGRMGTPEAEIYLASPAVVAASAVAGRIARPEELT